MCEKPVAHCVADFGAKLVAEYEAVHAPKGLVWAVLENYRFEPGLVRAGEAASSLIGSISMVDSVFHTPMPAGIRFIGPNRTNLLIEAGCHYTAALRMFAGCGVTDSAGVSSGQSAHVPHPDTLAASYKFTSGACATLSVTFATAARVFEVGITGSSGKVQVTRTAVGGVHGYGVTITSPGSGGPATEFHPFAGVAAAIRRFGECVRDGLPVDPRLSPQEALEDIRMVEAVVSKPLPQPPAQALED